MRPRPHEELLERIRLVRETERSYSSDESWEGVSSQGIALRDPDSLAVVGVAISYPTSLGTPELKGTIASLLDKMERDLDPPFALEAADPLGYAYRDTR